MEDVKIANNSTNNVYDYRFPNPGHKNPKVPGYMFGNNELYAWDIYDMKFN